MYVKVYDELKYYESTTRAHLLCPPMYELPLFYMHIFIEQL
jgi:hypothetical protein